MAIVIFLCFTSQVFANDIAPPIKAEYKAVQVSDHVYVVHGPPGVPSSKNQGFINNPGFVLTNDGVVVIDPGSSLQSGRMLLEFIDKTTDLDVIASFSTHIHGDHWLGNQAIKERYPNAKLYAHPNLIEQAKNGEGVRWIELLSQMTEGAIQGTQAIVPELPVNDRDVVLLGGIEFHVFHLGQAHTSSDIAIQVKPDNTLFTGDLVTNKRLGRFDDGKFAGLSDFLGFLVELKPTTVVPGHGATAGIEIIQQMKLLVDTVYQTILEKYEDGMSDFEIKPIVIEQLENFSDWYGFDEGIGRMISIGFLEAEEQSF